MHETSKKWIVGVHWAGYEFKWSATVPCDTRLSDDLCPWEGSAFCQTVFLSANSLQVTSLCSKLIKLEKPQKPHENPIPWMSTPWFPPSGEHQGLRRHLTSQRHVAWAALQLGRVAVGSPPDAEHREASLSASPGRTECVGGLDTPWLNLTQLDTCWHLGTQKLRHRSTESTVDLLRSLPWSKGTAAIGILWPSQPQCCGINVWGLQLADWATSWWCGVQQNMYRYLLSTWKLLCCQRCQAMIILKEHMNGRLGEERKKNTQNENFRYFLRPSPASSKHHSAKPTWSLQYQQM